MLDKHMPSPAGSKGIVEKSDAASESDESISALPAVDPGLFPKVGGISVRPPRTEDCLYTDASSIPRPVLVHLSAGFAGHYRLVCTSIPLPSDMSVRFILSNMLMGVN